MGFKIWERLVRLFPQPHDIIGYLYSQLLSEQATREKKKKKKKNYNGKIRANPTQSQVG
jgi:hypothetical protein